MFTAFGGHPYSEPLTFIFIYTAEQLGVKGLASELSQVATA